MRTEALRAVLKALSGKCHDSMADELDSPEDEVDGAVAEASEPSDLESEDGAEGEELAEEGDEAEEGEEAPADFREALRSFINPKPKASRPGTKVIIATEDAPKRPSPLARKAKGPI